MFIAQFSCRRSFSFFLVTYYPCCKFVKVQVASRNYITYSASFHQLCLMFCRATGGCLWLSTIFYKLIFFLSIQNEAIFSRLTERLFRQIFKNWGSQEKIIFHQLFFIYINFISLKYIKKGCKKPNLNLMF